MPDADEHTSSEHRIVTAISRWGLVLSMSAMIAGEILRFTTGGSGSAVVDVFHLGSMSPPGEFMAVGICMLAVTPVVNVGALLLHWARHRQLRLALAGLAVIAVLTAAVVLGTG